MTDKKKKALNACKESLKHLNKTKRLLTKARRLGILDIFSKNSFWFSSFKRHRIESANKELKKAEKQLRHLDNELKALGYSGRIQLSQINWLWDLWFDNVFADMNTQRKIKKTLNEVNDLINKVKQIEKTL